uniref:Uncharacterized protein n=1 Tax=Candidatus Kentrum sp. UNK TaxID=2126344 RepID=A0A451AR81_9GAMM|nr:MAG: hypothetical protein BECKUNK1418G_GA0071005_12452 [Candidatus Kentron sp. UNK]VFK73630.1 MAG: hypothetical protein BECKUNK1418H_GA0071006_12352 [Candidatus Kentron sp. UNK]
MRFAYPPYGPESGLLFHSKEPVPEFETTPFGFWRKALAKNTLAHSNRIQTGCSLRRRQLFRNFCFSDTLKDNSERSALGFMSTVK